MIDDNKIFDNHIHFNDESKYKDVNVKQLIEESNEHVTGWLCSSFDLISSKKAVEFSKEFENVFASIAIHPNDVQNFDNSVFDELEKLITNKKVVCIGETGLDYFYSKEHIKKQKEFFKKHISLAIKYNKVLQMHIRDQKDQFQAYDDVIEIIKDLNQITKVVHCFSANAIYAQKFLDLNCYINIGGAVTFKNAKDLQEAVKIIPLEKMLLETDAPYLAPHPYRGQVNHPKYIYLTALKIAELKNVDVKEVIRITTLNSKKIFNLN
ncbi:TatD family hydrolase [Mycoplasma mycoides]|uniref:TatD family deoxyribonuclease n=1 Tax=Mycoplasma mycoides subsp. capri TaxID=40477 RepID=A0AB38GFH4_MYCMC|nr:TatD family hydrolase [Mycoplasma mycoides]ADH22255.1 deoxyribonuclease, TatD family [synthetic Mycoplasma mycoides JCVI-syn1.0]AMW77163.1 putative deoxyribonuclease YcfH [synthetic bacterium JCVI-Syn2.0]ACU78994.1 deoxyribonuclease, TatD family [Mycoplasma mycoides subsp. capri str. GM12]ACU79825.1 deoxyribonuclease, TatD family [Mycoplasma mycoides subsp. capri str. GM12]SRX59299.1 TatD family deoxyribonuclease [Mycoplasma mycoides subsp. capri]